MSCRFLNRASVLFLSVYSRRVSVGVLRLRLRVCGARASLLESGRGLYYNGNGLRPVDMVRYINRNSNCRGANVRDPSPRVRLGRAITAKPSAGGLKYARM